jgi:hypothetical protein
MGEYWRRLGSRHLFDFLFLKDRGDDGAPWLIYMED